MLDFVPEGFQISESRLAAPARDLRKLRLLLTSPSVFDQQE